MREVELDELADLLELKLAHVLARGVKRQMIREFFRQHFGQKPLNTYIPATPIVDARAKSTRIHDL